MPTGYIVDLLACMIFWTGSSPENAHALYNFQFKRIFLFKHQRELGSVLFNYETATYFDYWI